MKQIDEDEFTTFILGDIRLHQEFPDPEESKKALRALEQVMIEYDIIKIDVGINPYLFPKLLL